MPPDKIPLLSHGGSFLDTVVVITYSTHPVFFYLEIGIVAERTFPHGKAGYFT
jgi:hypothetical protein